MPCCWGQKNCLWWLSTIPTLKVWCQSPKSLDSISSAPDERRDRKRLGMIMYLGFHILWFLHAGAFGQVYKGILTQKQGNEVSVAIKTIRSKLAYRLLEYVAKCLRCSQCYGGPGGWFMCHCIHVTASLKSLHHVSPHHVCRKLLQEKQSWWLEGP